MLPCARRCLCYSLHPLDPSVTTSCSSSREDLQNTLKFIIGGVQSNNKCKLQNTNTGKDRENGREKGEGLEHRYNSLPYPELSFFSQLDRFAIASLEKLVLFFDPGYPAAYLRPSGTMMAPKVNSGAFLNIIQNNGSKFLSVLQKQK